MIYKTDLCLEVANRVFQLLDLLAVSLHVRLQVPRALLLLVLRETTHRKPSPNMTEQH